MRVERTCVHRFKAGCLRPLDYTPSVLDRGAGAGCRTPACRLKAGCSAPELHPQGLMGSPCAAGSWPRKGTIHRPSPYEGAALPLSYRTSENWSPRSESNGHALRAPVSETGASACSATRGLFCGASPGARTLTSRGKSPVLCRSSSRRVEGCMRLGVTGRSRTGTGGVTSRSSAIELRPHPSARDLRQQRDAARLGPALEHVALVREGQPVGEASHLDRAALLVDFDGQQAIDPILRAPPE